MGGGGVGRQMHFCTQAPNTADTPLYDLSQFKALLRLITAQCIYWRYLIKNIAQNRVVADSFVLKKCYYEKYCLRLIPKNICYFRY